MKLREGSTFDGMLAEEGIYGEVTACAIARIVGHTVRNRMEGDGSTRAEAARHAAIGRDELEALLDETEGDAAARLPLATLLQAAAYGGLRLTLETAEPMRFDGPRDKAAPLGLSPPNRQRAASDDSAGESER